MINAHMEKFFDVFCGIIFYEVLIECFRSLEVDYCELFKFMNDKKADNSI
jgi:hypothetical protein